MSTSFKLERSSDGKMRRWAEGKMNPYHVYGSHSPCCGCCEGTYGIQDYVDGDFDISGCATCSSSLSPVWDGTFPSLQTIDVLAKCLYGISGLYKIGGKYLAQGGLTSIFTGNGTAIYLADETTRLWRMSVQCLNIVSSTFCVIWQGEKTGGDADGVYTRTTGTDTSATVTIYKVP